MDNKIYIHGTPTDVHEVPSMASSEAMLGLFFIDGSNLYHNLKASHISPKSVDIPKTIELLAKRLGVAEYKIIYFNSIPSIQDGKDKYFAHLKFLELLKKKGVEIHARKLQRLSNIEKKMLVYKELKSLELCGSCRPIIESHYSDYIGDVSLKEKGVDMAIAIEMIRHGLILKDCSRIILISGDADFVPCMDLLKTQGMEIMSASTAKGYSYELRDKHSWFIMGKEYFR